MPRNYEGVRLVVIVVSDGVCDGVSDWFLEEPELVFAEPELALFFL